jgi:type IV pilus assembly protein PilV
MRLTGTSFTATSRVAGFTLLEVLLTLVILSVGLLGLAAMQVVGLKSGNTASYRSIATLVAGEMAERMRANPAALGTINQTTGVVTESLFKKVDAGSTNCAELPDPYCSSWLDGTTVTPAKDCSPAEMAAFDINVMFCGNAKDSKLPKERTVSGLNMLPKGSMTISCSVDPCVPGAEHVITVIWEERPEGADAATASTQRTLVVNFTPLRETELPE